MSTQEVKRDLATLIRARCPVIYVITPEEETAEAGILEGAAMAGYSPDQVWAWDCGDGLQRMNGEPVTRAEAGIQGDQCRMPEDVFQVIKTDTARRIYILRDMHDWGDPVTKRQLRSLARRLSKTSLEQARTVVLLTPSAEIPDELKDHTVALEWPLPDRDEVGQILDMSLRRLPEDEREGVKLNGDRERAIDAAVGLTAQGVARCFSRSLVSTRGIDPGLIQREKRRIISSEKVLTWYEPNPRGMEAIGGLERLKADLGDLGQVMGQDARDFGVKAPKGLILAGAPGCGKSLAAQCIPAGWGVSLLRLDFGALQSKYVGESQANVRRAFQVAETMAPCVLWVDEIDKALGGAAGPQGDGGVSLDAVGTFLSWKQDCRAPVFVVATANNVVGLTDAFPELFRAGRWDGTYFIDLPHAAERLAILETTLIDNGRPPVLDSPLGQVVKLTEGFSGAELAAVVERAIRRTYLDGRRALTEFDLVEAARTVVPLSVSASESLTKVRDWARGRAIPASFPAPEADARQGGALDIG